ncbi:MAG: 2Fe-2S iron-sulfur cluster binding domain-containing protein [Alphaproteobacteria bacterium]|nr:2Fe-2S iron-sulfur cluster binding domain-containing protein [Alphaproteobacteria bacterium]
MATINVNVKQQTIDVDPETSLLWVLCDALNLVGTNYGCGIAHCGACTVHIDGQAVRSCQVPVGSLGAAKIVTIEGLAKNGEHPVQKAWLQHEVPQCGYCQSGQIMAAAALPDAGLGEQANLDLDSFERVTSRTLTKDERDRYEDGTAKGAALDVPRLGHDPPQLPRHGRTAVGSRPRPGRSDRADVLLAPSRSLRSPPPAAQLSRAHIFALPLADPRGGCKRGRGFPPTWKCVSRIAAEQGKGLGRGRSRDADDQRPHHDRNPRCLRPRRRSGVALGASPHRPEHEKVVGHRQQKDGNGRGVVDLEQEEHRECRGHVERQPAENRVAPERFGERYLAAPQPHDRALHGTASIAGAATTTSAGRSRSATGEPWISRISLRKMASAKSSKFHTESTNALAPPIRYFS